MRCSPEDPTRKWQHGASSKRARVSDEVAEASEPEELVRPTFGIERTHGTYLAPAGVFPYLADCIGTPAVELDSLLVFYGRVRGYCCSGEAVDVGVV
jgi:hypothetical protein